MAGLKLQVLILTPVTHTLPTGNGASLEYGDGVDTINGPKSYNGYSAVV
jgi:hypothetical protein